MVGFAVSLLFKAVGSYQSEILALRKGMWEKVASRKHKAIKIFPFGTSSDEAMLYGTVQYGLKAGGESGLDWAARAHLVKDGGRVKMDFYQVYLVSMGLFGQSSSTINRHPGHWRTKQMMRQH